jgi:hypothetical protein
MRVTRRLLAHCVDAFVEGSILDIYLSASKSGLIGEGFRSFKPTSTILRSCHEVEKIEK